MNYVHSGNALSKDFFFYIYIDTIYSYCINFMNVREQSAFSKYTHIHHELTSL